jgi:hypothetical protein
MRKLPRPLSFPRLSTAAEENTATSSFEIGERRRHRRHDIERQGISVQRWDGARSAGEAFGKMVDLSAGGVRVRTQVAVRADNQIRVRLELPDYAGISPFIDTSTGKPSPRRDWVGWMSICRVEKVSDSEYDVAGTLVDMEEMDRGMLGLYLSTQPLAA